MVVSDYFIFFWLCSLYVVVLIVFRGDVEDVFVMSVGGFDFFQLLSLDFGIFQLLWL